MRGRAAFGAVVAQSISLDVARLPYNRKLLRFLEEQYKQGREIYLATGADIALAKRVAEHLGIFKEVLGSDGALNLAGNHKLERLRTSLGSSEFDYIGNSTPDLPLLANSAQPMVANPSLALRIRLRSRKIHPAMEIHDKEQSITAFLRAMRPHQWTKNFLLVVPLLLSHTVTIAHLVAALFAFFSFHLPLPALTSSTTCSMWSQTATIRRSGKDQSLRAIFRRRRALLPQRSFWDSRLPSSASCLSSSACGCWCTLSPPWPIQHG